MNASGACPECGKPVASNDLEGLCAECMMAVALATQTAEVENDRTHRVNPPPALADVAKLFPQLEILECLGAGGMGALYKARQPRLDRFVALKILATGRADLTRDVRFAERFEREARALAKLNHPNIVAVYEFGEAGGLPYLIMEYVDGLNLRQLEHANRLSPREALQIVPQICEALQFAHDAGVVHRDIKPENIMLDRKGQVKIADFGIAKMVGKGAGQPAITRDEQVIGTPHYMAPEQVEHPQQVDHRADIYSLGVVFYEMLTGELPLGKFQAPSRKVQIDVRLDNIVLHALEKEPERRYQHASEVRTDVEKVASTPLPFRNLGTNSGQNPLTGTGLRRIFHGFWRKQTIWGATAFIAAAFFFMLLYRGPKVEQPQPVVKLAEGLSSSPSISAVAHVNEGFELLFKRNDPVGARALFEHCVREHPEYGECYHGLALAQREAGDPSKALPNHDRAIELSPDRADYYFARGMTQQRLKNLDAAIKDFELGVKQKPIECLTPGYLQIGLAQCYRDKGDFQKALEYNDQAITLNPQNKGFYRERAYTYQALGESQRAEADFRMSRASP